MNRGETCKIHNCFQEAIVEVPLECACEVPMCAFHYDKYEHGVRQYTYSFHHKVSECKNDTLKGLTKKMVIVNGKEQSSEEVVTAQDESDDEDES